jgi:hypothetical protein
MGLAGKTGAQIKLSPLSFTYRRRGTLPRQALSQRDPIRVGLEQRGLLEMLELFSGGKERGARAGAEIEQAGDLDVRRAQPEFRKDAPDRGVRGGQADGQIGGA